GAISADSTTIVGDYASGQRTVGFQYRNGVFLELPHVPGLQDPYSSAKGVSKDGSVIVGFTTGATGGAGTYTSRAFRWSASSGLTQLSTVTSSAEGITANGQIIVGATSARAVRCINGSSSV